MLELFFILFFVESVLSEPSYCSDSSDSCLQYSQGCELDLLCEASYSQGCARQDDGKCVKISDVTCCLYCAKDDPCTSFSPKCYKNYTLQCTTAGGVVDRECIVSGDLCVTKGTNPESPGTNPENPGTNPENPGTNPDNPGTNPDNPGTNPGSSSTNPNQENQNTNQNKATAGIVVGVVLGVVAIAVVGVVIFLLIRRRRKNEQQSNSSGEGDSTKGRCLFNAEAESAAPASSWGTETELNNVRGFPSQPYTRPPPQSTPASSLYPHPSSPSPSSSSLGRPSKPTRTHSPSLFPPSSANHNMMRPAGNFS